MKKLKKYKHFQLFADCCWGLQKMVAQYEGPSLRVRRDSDNVEQDIHFTGKKPGSWIDEKALLDFVGDNSGGYVTKFYDQQDNRRDWISVWSHGGLDSVYKTDLYQSVAGNQPQIVNSVGVGFPGTLYRNLYGEPCIKGDLGSTSTKLTLVRKFAAISGVLLLSRIQRTDQQPVSDSQIMICNFTSTKNQTIDEESASEFKSSIYGRPAVMLGTDTNYYYCTKDGSTTTDRRPITGVDYATYWLANPVGNSIGDLFDYDTESNMYNYNSNPTVTFFEDGVTNTYTSGMFEEITRDRNLAIIYCRGIDYDKKIKSNSNDNLPVYSWSLNEVTHLVNEATTPSSTTSHGSIGSKVDLYNNFCLSREEFNGAYCLELLDKLSAVLRAREV